MLISVVQAQFFFLALTRVLAILLQLPFLNNRSVPNQVKIALGFFITMIMVPWKPLPVDVEALGILSFAAAIFQELVIGILVGFAVTMTFGVFQIVGKLMELGSGFSAGQIFNPTLGEMASAYDQLFMMVVYLYFFMVNGHHLFLMGLDKTFDVFPINSSITGLSFFRLIETFATLMTSAFQLALPVMGAILLADLTLGLLARVAPQIQVFFLGLPVKVWLGVVALGLSFTILLPLVGQLIQEMGNRMIRMLGV